MDHRPKLTPEQEDMIDKTLREMQDSIAASLGLQRQPDGRWSDEEAAHIIAECDRLYRSFFVNCVLA